MKILALDTATQSCSVAIIDGEQLLAELTRANVKTHSRHLMDLIETVCLAADLSVRDMDGFAVTIGPGSFTGLRIGISTIKGLAFSLSKPVAGVSSLEALAWQCAQSAYLICPLLDARKKEVYAGRYRFKNNKLKRDIAESVVSPAEAVSGIREPCLFVGNAAQIYRGNISAKLGELAHFASPAQHTIRASSIAWLSMSGFQRKQTEDVALLVPHYIRKPDAEIKSYGKRIIG
ncbi:MAG: tRNA (adenosine(37)-N6)-threonylcarbamoyltransferase complex dimerization subunit type 1 TsaB [Desulfobacterales bacterium]|jgi:tRNA threonylcarbamoyladenosine biosynthesis protein TsaB